jgi:hypothetical protein
VAELQACLHDVHVLATDGVIQPEHLPAAAAAVGLLRLPEQQQQWGY